MDDMVDLLALSRGRGEACASNQVLYNLTRRGIEFDLVPLCREHGMPIMAYSPIEQGRMLQQSGAGRRSPRRSGATPAQVALAWLLAAGRRDRDSEGHQRSRICARTSRALDVTLDEATLAALDRAFPPPKKREPLAML